MGYFEGITANYFKTDEEGRTVFYPYGILGRGFIVPEERKTDVRRIVTTYTLTSLPIAIAATALLKWWLVLSAVLPVYLLAFSLHLTKLTSTFEKSSHKLTVPAVFESAFSSINSCNLLTLWLIEIGSVLFLLTGIYLIITSPQDWYKGALPIAFFGFMVFAGMKMAKARKRKEPAG